MTTPKLDLSAFKPDANQIRAARNLFTAMAHAELVVPIVEAYQRAVLETFRWKPAARWEGRIGDDAWCARPILDPRYAYLMNDVDFAAYVAACRIAQVAAKLVTESPDYCPKLVAENLLLCAQADLVEAMEPVTKVDWSVVSRSPKTFDTYMGLTLRLLAPFVGTADEIVPVPATA